MKRYRLGDIVMANKLNSYRNAITKESIFIALEPFSIDREVE